MLRDFLERIADIALELVDHVANVSQLLLDVLAGGRRLKLSGDLVVSAPLTLSARFSASIDAFAEA